MALLNWYEKYEFVILVNLHTGAQLEEMFRRHFIPLCFDKQFENVDLEKKKNRSSPSNRNENLELVCCQQPLIISVSATAYTHVLDTLFLI